MTKLGLQISADLENIACVTVPANFSWCFDVRDSGGETTRKNVTFSENETMPVPTAGRKTLTHLVLSFDPQSKHYSTITLLKDPPSGICTESGKWQTMCVMECRGIEPVLWHFEGSEFEVKTMGGTQFLAAIDKTGAWTEYCTKLNEPVGIYNLKFQVVRL